MGYFELDQTLQTSTGELSGTLTVPILKGTFPVALIIAGSGPTDRNGNNAQMKNNVIKLLLFVLKLPHPFISKMVEKKEVFNAANYSIEV